MEFKEHLRKMKNTEYQHMKIERKYEEDVRLPELKWEEQIKHELKQLYRPIWKDELDDHEWAYQEAKRNKDK